MSSSNSRLRRSHNGRRHRRNNDEVKYTFKVQDDGSDDPKAFLNVTRPERRMASSLSDVGSRRFVQLKKMVSFSLYES